MYCLDKAIQDILIIKSKLLINTNHTNVKTHAHRQTDTHPHTLSQNYVFPYIPISVCSYTEKPLERHDPKYQQSLGSMGLGSRDSMLKAYISIV